MSDYQEVDILLVEDTATDAEMTIRSLRKKGMGTHLLWLKDGSEALDFLFSTGSFAGQRVSRPKLILLDVKMPKIDGIEVLRRMRQDESLHTIPVIMLTSSAEESDIVESYRLGANSYIVKPVEAHEFIRVVTEAGHYWTLMNRTPNGKLRP